MTMKKILIVEDDSFLVDVYVTKLESKGYETEAARTGEEGLALMKNQDFDLVILDITLPEMDGWQVLTEMRKNEKTKNTKVLIFSNSEIQDKDKIKELNVEKYLVKVNYTSGEVISEIEQALS